MKKQFLLIGLAFLFAQLVQAQTHNPVLGQYDGGINQGINTENDVVITQDPQSKKKIWISGILTQGKIYALVNLVTEDQQQYTIPAQTVNGKTIRSGWILLKINDEDEGKDEILISNDPKANPNEVSITDKGMIVKDADGKEMVNMNKDKVKVDAGGGNKMEADNTKDKSFKASSGDLATAPYFTYMGNKPTRAGKD
ncbi:MAG: hypothetical protein H7Y04_10845 [Verrucomicrobia bacterium]|nr:hypothetical protein [Cytophagales bacterium]